MSNYLNANQIITPSQSGFTPKDSTVYQSLSIYDDFCESFDSEITTQVIFLNISKRSIKYGTVVYYGNHMLLKLEALYFIGSKTIWLNVNRLWYSTLADLII